MFLVKGGRGQKYALKRMAVNNEQDLYLARQEVAVTVSYTYCCTRVGGGVVTCIRNVVVFVLLVSRGCYHCVTICTHN